MAINFAALNCLESVEFFANSDFILYYVFKESDGVTPFNLTGATVIFILFPYGQTGTPVLQKEAIITGESAGECNVAIEPDDTAGFDAGKYIQQVVVTKSGKTYRPAQGDVYIAESAYVSGG